MIDYLICLAFCLFGAETSTLPDRILNNMCKKSDPNYSKCLLQTIEILRTDFMSGIQEIGFTGFDPIITSSTTFNQDDITPGTSVNVNLENSSLTGFGNALFTDLTADPSALTGQLSCDISLCQVNTKFTIIGQITNIVKVNLAGDFQGNFSLVKLKLDVQLNNYSKNGIQYLGVDKLTIGLLNIKTGNVNIKATDLIKQGAADFISNYYNKNQELVTNAVFPMLLNVVSDFFGKKLEDLLSRAPASAFIPN